MQSLAFKLAYSNPLVYWQHGVNHVAGCGIRFLRFTMSNMARFHSRIPQMDLQNTKVYVYTMAQTWRIRSQIPMLERARAILVLRN